MERLCRGIIKTPTDEFSIKVQKKLAEYENAEEQGLLLRLPCKVGDTLYSIEEDCIEEECKYYHEPSQFEPYGVCNLDKDDENYCNRLAVHALIMVNRQCIFREVDHFGKTVFLTEQEAEAKLKELTGD